MMCDPMILGGTSLHALTHAADPADPDGFGIGPGLGFFPWGVVDQHFLQRGRIGRLLAAQRASGAVFGFGVDENSALIVEGETGRVCGETGVIVVDLRDARFDTDGWAISSARISYLDDGDGFDFARGVALPGADKHPLAVEKRSYCGGARVRRHAFAAYTLLDLLLRLIEGDPARYPSDFALADDEHTGLRIRLEIGRDPARSQALRAVRADGELRYSALDFSLALHRHVLTRADTDPEQIPLPAVAHCAAARLVLLGSSPVRWARENLAGLLAELRAPVGVLPLASTDPRRMGRQYLDWLRQLGIEAELLDVSRANIERADRDEALLARVGAVGSLLFTGGDQRLLTDVLLHCGEPGAVLGAILATAARGTPLIAVAAAAAAMGERMIVDGESAGALRLGASEDAGFEGVVVESGLALARCGLIDQNFLQRHRLGRLLVACAATGSHFGFGLCEEAGLVLDSGTERVRAIGRGGVIVAELDPARARLAPPDFDPVGIDLHLVEPGEEYDLRAPSRSPPSTEGRALLERAVRDLARDCNEAMGRREPRIDAAQLRELLLDRAVA